MSDQQNNAGSSQPPTSNYQQGQVPGQYPQPSQQPQYGAGPSYNQPPPPQAGAPPNYSYPPQYPQYPQYPQFGQKPQRRIPVWAWVVGGIAGLAACACVAVIVVLWLTGFFYSSGSYYPGG